MPQGRKALVNQKRITKPKNEPTECVFTDQPIEPNSAEKLDENMVEALRKMNRMNEIIERLPGYDCGSCGSPTCATFAEDIVRGYCTEMDCVHLLREKLKIMAEVMVELAQSRRE